jgi:hypothetical protein
MSRPVPRWEPRYDRQPDRDGALVNSALVNTAVVNTAITEREQGRARLNSTTVTVGFASVAVAAVVGFSLPGPVSHATTTNTGTSSGQQNQGNQGNSGLNPPGYVPVSGGGGNPVSTSGGTSSGRL